MTKMNVLIFPAGETNSIELHDSLTNNVNIEVFGCSSIDRHGAYVFKNYKSGLPNIADRNFIEKFNEVIKAWNIDFVFPTHDTVALFLAKNQKMIDAKVIGASYETAKICRDKRLTYEIFKKYNFCPKQYTDFDQLPVFIKPRDGQGGKGAKLVTEKKDIPIKFDYENYVISEFLPGEELTVDCFTDANGTLGVCLPRIRNRLMAGICVAGQTVAASDEICAIATEINERLDLFGLWYFQVKKSVEGHFKLLEVSTRCAGTMCLSRARGINLPLLSVYAAAGKEVSIFENPYKVIMDRAFISRYKISYKYESVYIDYDDTVINGDLVILKTIRFLYQCKNKGIKTILLTRHEMDHCDSVEESLEKHAIAKSLFSTIIKLTDENKKSDFIRGKSILIDNSYSERKEVYEALRIPVFDVEGIEVLADWRV